MPPIIRMEKIANYEGQEVTIQGWVYNRTDKGKLVFLLVRDGYGFAQCVAFKSDLPAELFEQITRLPQETSVVITGKVRADQRAPGIPGGYELGIKDLQVVQVAGEDYPMALKEHGVISPWIIATCGSACPASGPSCACAPRSSPAIREWLDTNGYIHMDTPILTPAACEGTTTLFETPYFDEGLAYLAQSGQLYNEANIFAFGKVYCFGPTFRAEKSKTRRHLTEFWMVEPEVAFCDLDQLMEIEEQFITHIVQRVLRRCGPRAEVAGPRHGLLEQVAPPFPRISYDEAVKMIEQIQAETDDPEKKELLEIEWGMDFGSPHETALTQPFRQAGLRLWLSHRGQGLLHGAVAGPPRSVQERRPARPRRLWRDHRRQRAHLQLRAAAGAHAPARPARGCLPVVPRPAPVRQRSAFRLRPGRRAHRVVDDRHRPHP